MTQFAAVLKTALRDQRWSQGELARRAAGMDQSSLSRFLSGDNLPRKNTLEQICRLFPEHIRRALTAAYLTDQIPDSAAQLVAISAIQEGPIPQHEYRVGQVPEGSILWKDLQDLGRAAITRPNLAKMLNYLAAEVRGEAPNPAYYESEGDWKVQEDPRLASAQEELKRSGKRPAKGRQPRTGDSQG